MGKLDYGNYIVIDFPLADYVEKTSHCFYVDAHGFTVGRIYF